MHYVRRTSLGEDHMQLLSPLVWSWAHQKSLGNFAIIIKLYKVGTIIEDLYQRLISN